MYFLSGLLIGIAMTAPVGGVNIMCLRKALNFGFWAGFRAAFGAIVADAVFAGIAIFGIGYVFEVITQYEGIIQAVGGVVVIGFALMILNQKSDVEIGLKSVKSDPGGPLTSFALTITNPGTVFGFLALFTALSKFIPPPQDVATGLVLLAGVVAGCALWWFVVAGVAARYRHAISSKMLTRINMVTGLALLIFGLVILVRLAVSLIASGALY